MLRCCAERPTGVRGWRRRPCILQWWRPLATSRRAEIWTLFGSLCCGIFHKRFSWSGDGDCVVVGFFVVPWSRKGCYFVMTTATSVFRLLVFSTCSFFHFFGGMVSAALWFFDSLIFCSGALIGYISSMRSFSSFLASWEAWVLVLWQVPFSFLRRWDFFWDSFVILPDEGETRNVVTFNRLW